MTRARTRMVARAAFAFALSCVIVVAVRRAPAQEKKKGEDKDPRVTLVSPLGVAPGAAVVLKVRGLRLAEATELRFTGTKAEVKASIKSKGKAEMSAGQEAAEVGDTQVEVGLTLPADTPPGGLQFAVVTPAGETKPHELMVVDARSLVEEKEPNDGFQQAQRIAVSKVVQGAIRNGDDVDVFRFEGKSGQKVVAEVVAARHGSALDSLLTLYDAAGHIIASNDDGSDNAGNDSILRFKCPTDGRYFIAITDANGRGGPAHPYLLSLKADE